MLLMGKSTVSVAIFNIATDKYLEHHLEKKI